MQIQELFYKDINRPINGVIKVGQDDEANIYQELDEYVVTHELDGHFRTFFDRHNSALDQPTDKMGVWIAGFFGSGKSHFLKILAYLLENRAINGKRAFDFFDDVRISDGVLRANIQRSVNTDADVILFNIDSKADAGSKSQKDSIVKVFQKVFDEKLGYFGAIPAIADFERRLDQRGIYLAFKNAFQALNGNTWESERNSWHFEQSTIQEALQTVTGMAENEARLMVEAFSNQTVDISPEKFARSVKEYLDQRGKHHQIMFMVDEVGQYIGANSDLMLNLQTVVEDLGIHCKGRAWVIVTSQEAMDEITKNRIKGNDFSKIVGRFGRPISLSSANTDEVIRLRLLVKSDGAKSFLQDLYVQKEAVLKNQITFSEDCAELLGYRDRTEFASTYPFVPYQFKLLQKVFEQIRLTGAAGKHLAMGERSLLDAFQIAAKDVAHSETGVLVPFDRFYAAIEGFLDTSVKRAIAQAADNSQLQEKDDLPVLKTLFMIKYVQSIRANLDNLTTLCLSDIDQDKLALCDRLKSSLERLERQTLIQREGDIYIFLTQEEQEIGREIKKININNDAVIEQLQSSIWNTIFPDKKYRYDERHQYEFNRKIDDRASGNQQYDFTLHLITPNYDRYGEMQDDTACLMMTHSQQEVIVRLPDDQRLLDEITELVRTDDYIHKKSRLGLSVSIQKILDARRDQNSKRKEEITSILRSQIAEADVFACGNKVNIPARDAKNVITEGLRYLVENLYSKLGYVQSVFKDEAQIMNAFTRDTEQQNLLDPNHPNAAAHADLISYLADEVRSHRRVSIRNLLEKFRVRPYGWDDFDILGILAEVINQGKAELRHHAEVVNPKDPKERDLVKKLTSKLGKEEYLIRLTEEVNLATVKVARDLASELFDQNPASDWQKLYEQYRESFKKQITALQGWLAQAERDRLPFVSELQTYQQLIQNLLDHDGAANFFRAIQNAEVAIEKYIDDRDKLNSFFGSQVIIFQEAIAQIKSLQPDLHHIQEQELRQRVETAQQILALSDPTKRIPELKTLLSPVQSKVREALQAKIEKVQQQSLKLREQVQVYVTQAHGDLGDRLDLNLVELDRVMATANQSATIDAAIARSSELANLYSTLINRIDQQAESLQQQLQAAASREASSATSTVSPDPKPLPTVKPIAVIRATSAVTKPILETEEEVKEYLTALGRVMMKEIRQGKRVRLE
jgi:hypothetical protein